MRPEDAELTARAVKKSLEQVLDACGGTGLGAGLTTKETVPAAPDTMLSGKLYTCRNVATTQNSTTISRK
jgi:ribose 5-phosphate isomerase